MNKITFEEIIFNWDEFYWIGEYKTPNTNSYIEIHLNSKDEEIGEPNNL